MFNLLKKHFEKSIKEITEKKLSEKDVDNFFKKWEVELVQMDVALEVVDYLRNGLKDKVVGEGIKRSYAKHFIKNAFKKTILNIFPSITIDIKEIIKNCKQKGKPACFIFLGFNGSGKTTSIAKIAKYLLDIGYKVVLAAGDTWRSASIEQLEHHGKCLGIKVIKHKYGADPAAVIFDAIKYAKAKNCDVILSDTAGRTHTDRNLMDELKKIIRVNKPELKILVLDSLTGNDVVEQARIFDKEVGIDCSILTKIDVNPKGGSILSVCYSTKKPIIFLGIGQNYNDLKEFKPDKFVSQILGD